MVLVDEFCGWAALGLLLAAGLVSALGIWRRPRGQRLLCRGPRPGWAGRLDPRRWLFRRGCWYNLTGLPEAADGAVRCPECGTISTPEQRLRDGRRWRPETLGILLVFAALASFCMPWLRGGQWVAGVPSLVLVASEYLGRDGQPRAMRREMQTRVTTAGVDAVSAWLLSRRLVVDLRDDEVRYNAERAAEMLVALWPSSRAALEAELACGDHQSRVIAADVLRRCCRFDPSDALLAACVADLRDDPVRIAWWTYYNARDAAEYLCAFPQRAEPFLRPALASDDAQQRVMAAAVAGYSGLCGLVDEAAPILIAELADDGVTGNARLAAPALYRFGPCVIPSLEPLCASGDWQVRAIARAIVERLRHPGRTASRQASSMPRITEITTDPLGLSIESALQ